MSAEILRRAASEMRSEANKVCRPFGRDERVAHAVAAWLDGEFNQADLFGEEHPEPRCECHAHAVARAYLGESS